MQNFKQFLLTENVITPGNVHFMLNVTLSDTIMDAQVLSLFQKAIKGNNINVSYSNDTNFDFTIIVENLSKEEISEHNLETIQTTIEKTINRVIKEEDTGDQIDIFPSLVCDGYPPFELEHRTIELYMLPNQRITGIEKFIGLCETCYIFNCENIVGGVLSLLKSKENIILDSNVRLKWVEIVAKHLGKDLLDCQEELISAGLKEFAKF